MHLLAWWLRDAWLGVNGCPIVERSSCIASSPALIVSSSALTLSTCPIEIYCVMGPGVNQGSGKCCPRLYRKLAALQSETQTGYIYILIILSRQMTTRLQWLPVVSNLQGHHSYDESTLTSCSIMIIEWANELCTMCAAPGARLPIRASSRFCWDVGVGVGRLPRRNGLISAAIGICALAKATIPVFAVLFEGGQGKLPPEKFWKNDDPTKRGELHRR